MSILAKITSPKKPKNKYVNFVVIILAMIIVLVSLWQLFSLDDFLNKITGYNLPGGDGVAMFLGCFVIVLEVFSLPFLLGLNLSVAMRFCSMISGWLMVVIHVFLWYWSSIYGKSLNSFDELVVAIWLLLPFIVVGALVAVSSWGMWPIIVKAKTEK